MSTKTNKILENIHPLAIIKEVQKWPVLYSKDSRERGNLHFKMKVWNEVAKALFPPWDAYTDAEKECRVTDLCKRWRNLRDTFKRQVQLEKKIRKGHESKKRPYIYFKPMLFLLPHVEPLEDAEESIAPSLDEYFNKQESKTPDKRKRKPPVEQHFIVDSSVSAAKIMPKTSAIDEIDEDRHFALSLIPTLKKMSDDEKLTAKMEILKVLREIRNQSAMDRTGDGLYHVELESNHSGSQGVKIEYLHTEDNEDVQNDSDSENSE